MTYTIKVANCADASMPTPTPPTPSSLREVPPAPPLRLLSIPWLRSTPSKSCENFPSISTTFDKLCLCECLGCGQQKTLQFQDPQMHRIASSPDDSDRHLRERSRLDIFPRSSGIARSRSPATGDCLDTDRTERERKRWKQLLKGVFDHLAGHGEPRRSAPFRSWRERKMDKETFLQVFPQLPGVVGERLFAAFDLNRNGSIDFEEFVSGLSVLSAADLGQKLQFIFHMYDLNGDGELSRDELAMMLYHIPASISFLAQTQPGYPNDSLTQSPGAACRPSSSSIAELRLKRRLKTVQTSALLSRPDSDQLQSTDEMGLARTRRCSSNEGLQRRQPNAVPVNEKMFQLLRRISPNPDVSCGEDFEALIDRLVDHAFEIFEKDHVQPQMDYETFCRAVVKFPDLRAALEIFCSDTIPPQAFMPIPADILIRELKDSHLRTATQSLATPGTPRDGPLLMECNSCAMKYEVIVTTRDSSSATPHGQSGKRCTPMSAELAKLPCFRGHGGQADKFGWLEKDGKVTGLPKRRFFILRDRFLYYYHDISDVTPAQAFVLTGCHVDRALDDRTQAERVGDCQGDDMTCPRRFQSRYGFDLLFPQGRKARLYCRGLKERDDWVAAIGAASGSASSHFHEIYLLKEALGVGRFATVFAASRRATGERVAVKVLRRPNRLRSEGGNSSSKRSRHWRRFLRRRPSLRKDQSDSDSYDDSDATLQLFQRTEVAVLRLLNHPNLIRLLDVFSTPEFLYIVMEWNPASDVQKIINMVNETNKRLREQVDAHELDPAFQEIWVPEWIVRESVIGILRGLVFLHSPKRNVIHRDLKPDNVLLKVDTTKLRFCFQQAFPSLPRFTPEGRFVSFRVRSERSNTTPSAAASFIQHPSPLRQKPLPKEFAEDEQHGTAQSPSSADHSDQWGAERPGSDSGGSSIDTLDLYTVKHGVEDSTALLADLQAQLSQRDSSPLEVKRHIIRFADSSNADSISSKYELLLARETLNFWLFINSLDFSRNARQPQLQAKESTDCRNDRRHSTMPATLAPRWTGVSLPAFLTSPETSDILSHSLNRLSELQLAQKVCPLFSETSLIQGSVVPQITDFGLSKIIAPPEQRLREDLPLAPIDMTGYAKEALGTVAYAAPEVLQGLRYTTSADLWSLGVMTYQLLSGGAFPTFADVEGGNQANSASAGQRSCSLAELPASFTLSKAKLMLLYVPESAWTRVSQGAKAFVAKLLSVDPQTRISAKAALEDNWVTQQWPPQDRWFC